VFDEHFSIHFLTRACRTCISLVFLRIMFNLVPSILLTFHLFSFILFDLLLLWHTYICNCLEYTSLYGFSFLGEEHVCFTRNFFSPKILGAQITWFSNHSCDNPQHSKCPVSWVIANSVANHQN
jgi:hypothetical protein